jgi:Glutathionylspermidine synthase preATP-grasp
MAPDLSCAEQDLCALPALDAVAMQEHRWERIARTRKWDPQIGDAATIAGFALRLRAAAWRRLAAASEALAAECAAIEARLAARPELLGGLGLPLPLLTALRRGLRHGPPAVAARVLRFDWHPTASGWRISEVNADVPGGWDEAGSLCQLLAARYGLATAGEPAALLAQNLQRRLGSGARLALVHCTSYSDDRQVMEGLAQACAAAGMHAVPCAADHLAWRHGRARFACAHASGAVDGIIRFTPAEWLPELRTRCAWRQFFRGGGTPAANPGLAVALQSKRLPILWPRLELPLTMWRAALPPTCDVRLAPWRRDGRWLVKPALGRVGEDVTWRGRHPGPRWRRTARQVALQPRAWVAQHRFASRPVATPQGPQHACLGIYTIDGRACGIYGRIVAEPPIAAAAGEVAVLVGDR